MSQTIEQLVGQLTIAGFRGKDANPDSSVAGFIQDYNIGGVILYDEDLEYKQLGSRNINSPQQLSQLTQDLQSLSSFPLLITIDQEGGEVNRLKSYYGFPECPDWQHFGLLNNTLMTQQYSEILGETLLSSGINVNFAPVLDLDYGNDSVIGKLKRSISTIPEIAITHSKILIQELKERNIISCGKHFPGQGSASSDTHEGFTDISETWTVKDLLPFDKLIQSGDLDMIMVAHTFDEKLDPKYPASLSKKIITNVLRNDLGFSGVVICDDPSMKAISDNYDLETTFELMLNAGVDLFCFGNNLYYDADYFPQCVKVMASLIKSGKIKENRIHESIARIDSLKKKYGII